MEKLPYILLHSAPIGPIALQALMKANYPPVFVIDNPKMSLEEQLELVERYKPSFLLVVGYGAILKRALLDSVAGQVLNIHPSYLPEYRGPAPVVQTLLDGVLETGVTLIEIDTKVDHGPILAQEHFPLRGNELPEELYTLLTVKGVDLFLENINDYLNEELEMLPQTHDEASFTHFISKEDGRLDFSKPTEELEREIRAYHGWPRSWTEYEGKRLIFEKAHLEAGKLVIDMVQPENGTLMTVKQFCAGKRIKEEAFYEYFNLT